MTLPTRIGIDLDNTLIRYDRPFNAAARAMGLLPEGFQGGKQAVRDALRRHPGGETLWRTLQGRVYGHDIHGAELMPGADAFLRHCRNAGIEVHIVSHKSRLGHHDPQRIDLREAARGWLEGQGFFTRDGFAIPPEHLWFEATRAEKLARIESLSLPLFIDDLPELLLDPAFPEGTARWLLCPEGPPGDPSGDPSGDPARDPRLSPYRHWDEIDRALFASHP